MSAQYECDMCGEEMFLLADAVVTTHTSLAET
jgi:hypothetical protein